MTSIYHSFHRFSTASRSLTVSQPARRGSIKLISHSARLIVSSSSISTSRPLSHRLYSKSPSSIPASSSSSTPDASPSSSTPTDPHVQAILSSSSLLPSPHPEHLSTLLSLLQVVPSPVPLPLAFDTIETLLHYNISLVPSATPQQKPAFVRSARTLEGVWRTLLEGEKGLSEDIRRIVGQRVYGELLEVYGSCGGWEDVKGLVGRIEQEGVHDEAFVPNLLETAKRYSTYLRAQPSFSPLPVTSFLLRLLTLASRHSETSPIPSHHLKTFLQIFTERFTSFHLPGLVESASLMLKELQQEDRLRSDGAYYALMGLMRRMDMTDEVDRLWELVKSSGVERVNAEVLNQYLSELGKRSNPALARQEWDLLLSNGYIPTGRNFKQLIHALCVSTDWLEAAHTIASLSPSTCALTNDTASLASNSSPSQPPSPSELIMYLLNLITTANEKPWPSGAPTEETIAEMRRILGDAFGEQIWVEVREALQAEIERETKRLREKENEAAAAVEASSKAGSSPDP